MEDKLWAALHANPNSTTAELFSAAKIGKSTAAKILAKWADDGSVTRIVGIAEGGGRAADRWAITEHDSAEPTDAVLTDAVPTDAVPTDAEPTDRVPTDAAMPCRRTPSRPMPTPQPNRVCQIFGVTGSCLG